MPLPEHDIKVYTFFRTQKARGVAWLSRGCKFCGMKGAGRMPRLGIDADEADAVRVWPYDATPNFPFFARPCPTVPRHGFVESRMVEDPTVWAQVVMETYLEEKDAEIIMMPRLSGKYSAVATPTCCTIGKSNDGVTAGKGVMVRIPCPRPASLAAWNYTFSGTKNYPNAEAVYLEAVEDAGEMCLVQARPGPVLEDMVDFVPKDTTVTGVFLLDKEYSLLDWEKWVKAWKLAEGFVVHAPGSSLASHYAVHCIQNGVPFLTRKDCPKVGDVLTKEAGPKVTKLGRDRFIVEVKARLEGKTYNDGKQGTQAQRLNAGLALSVAHAHSLWGNDALSAKLRARGIISLIRFTAMACVGEARHFYTSGPGKGWYGMKAEHLQDLIYEVDSTGLTQEEFFAQLDPKIAAHKAKCTRGPTLPWEDECHPEHTALNHIGAGGKVWKPDRSDVYAHLTHKDFETLMGYLPTAAEDLRQPGWKEGMGGDRWAEAARAGWEAWQALQLLMEENTGKNWRRFCEKWNLLAFSVHNGGKILNKWCSADLYAAYPSAGFTSAALMILEEARGEKVEAFEKAAEKSGWEEPESEDINPADLVVEGDFAVSATIHGAVE